jgi:cation diffusion facilitator CzcD-associated flavoprotein CzcO
VAILGAGFAGLCMAIQLDRARIGSFTVFEKSDGPGGTWRDNAYPGAGCDVPSHLYSFSFWPSPSWSRHYAGQQEILSYLERCVDHFGLRDRLRFGSEVVAARFDARTSEWRLELRGGETFTADVLVTGLGQLNRPVIPSIPGLDAFEGRAFHSARWDHSHDLRGANVAVVGTGASAIQFVPRIAPEVAKLAVYQRSPGWLLPRNDAAYSESWKLAFERLPAVRWLHRAAIYWMNEARFLGMQGRGRHLVGPIVERMAREHLETQVPDPALRAKLLPDYPIGCKRVLISDDYYPALARPNVDLVTMPIARIARDGVVTDDGVLRRADTIIFGTGFAPLETFGPPRIVGRGGLELTEAWQDGAEAYCGLAVTGFPNLFVLYGPNTNLGHNSIVFMLECQVGYVVRCLTELVARRRNWMEVRRDVMDTYNRDLQARMHGTVWEAGCSSWYKTEAGKVTNNWPRFTFQYMFETRTPRFEAFGWG